MYSSKHLELKTALLSLGKEGTHKAVYQLICDF
jgi:hypothetical protein